LGGSQLEASLGEEVLKTPPQPMPNLSGGTSVIPVMLEEKIGGPWSRLLGKNVRLYPKITKAKKAGSLAKVQV
jgi:hypothetical protein